MKLISITIILVIAPLVFCLDKPILHQTTTGLARGGTGLLKEQGLDAFLYNPANLYNKDKLINELQFLSPQVSTSKLGEDLFNMRDRLDNLNMTNREIIERWGKETQFIGANFILGISFSSISFGFYNISYGEIKTFIEGLDTPDTKINELIDINVFLKNGAFIAKSFKINEHIKIGVSTKIQHKKEFIPTDDSKTIIEIMRANKNKKL